MPLRPTVYLLSGRSGRSPAEPYPPEEHFHDIMYKNKIQGTFLKS